MGLDGAEKEYRRAIELNGNYSTVHHWYSFLLLGLGRLDAAIAEGQRALELDPWSVSINTDLGIVYAYAGRTNDALQQYKKAMEIDPKFPHEMLATLYIQEHKYAEALAEYKEEGIAVGDQEEVTATNTALRTLKQSGYSAALRVFAEQLEKSKFWSAHPYDLGETYFWAEDKERGFRWLERAYSERDPNFVYLKSDSAILPFRSDPRYADLLRRIGLPQ